MREPVRALVQLAVRERRVLEDDRWRVRRAGDLLREASVQRRGSELGRASRPLVESLRALGLREQRQLEDALGRIVHDALEQA